MSLRIEVVGPLIAAGLLISCTGGSDPGGPLPQGVGRVEASLGSSTNAPPGGMQIQSTGPGQKLKVKEIIVTIAKVTAHSTSAGWRTLSTNQVTVDVLKLAQYAQPLGFANMPSGKITQVRLYVAESGPQYVTRDDGVRVDLKVPSGIQSGIKLKGIFDIAGCQSTNLPIDIDGKRSIWVHPTGQGDEWILRPVIRMGTIEASNVGCATPTNPTNPTPTDPTVDGTRGNPGPGINEGPGLPGTDPVGGTGSTCANSLSCLSASCVNGVCSTGGPDLPCHVGLDCASGACSTDGTCTLGTAGGTGSACTAGSQCLSSDCVSGHCVEGSQGQPCAVVADCAGGFTCTGGSCEPIPL